MPWEGGYVLQLWCDQPGCTVEREFVGNSEKTAVRKANGAGWRVTFQSTTVGGRGFAFCPGCRDANTSIWNPPREQREQREQRTRRGR